MLVGRPVVMNWSVSMVGMHLANPCPFQVNVLIGNKEG